MQDVRFGVCACLLQGGRRSPHRVDSLSAAPIRLDTLASPLIALIPQNNPYP